MASSNRKTPKNVFEDPDEFLEFLTAKTDREFEGQFFDRKEVCRADNSGTVGKTELLQFRDDHIVKTLSAFANENRDGGLLVLGIASDGTVPGVDHLSERQLNSISSFEYLVGHHCQFKLHAISIGTGTREIALILAPYSARAICQTAGKSKRAWRRSGTQNIELTDSDLEAIRRNKRIVDYERTHCAKFNAGDVDMGLYKEFSRSTLDSASYEWTPEQLLDRIGAIEKNGDTWFTNAGKLFFCANPGRDIPQAYIRVLRFDVAYDDRKNRPTPTYDKNFTGPLTKQIHDFRAFIKDSAFFDIYQRRKEGGGFVEEPEYPSIAIDEAVVNAVSHRDYAIAKPILCEKYADAFVVVSPGAILQGHDVPEHFSLADTSLQHYTRNPKLMEWLRQMRDAQGRAFVQALEEGTRRMRDEMAKLGLPSPEYTVSDYGTTLVLRNNSHARKDVPSHAVQEEGPEFTNLYPLVGVSVAPDFERAKQQRREIQDALKNKLAANGWFIDRDSYGVITAHRRGVALPAPANVSKVVKLYPAYVFQIKEYFGKLYLLVDFTVTVQTVLYLSEVLTYLDAKQMVGLRSMAQVRGWSAGKLTEIEADHSKVAIFDYKSTESVPNNKIIPRLPSRLVKHVLQRIGSSYDLSLEIRKATFALSKDASRKRADYTQAVVDDLLTGVLPLKLPSSSVTVSPNPLHISARGDGSRELRVDSLTEPQVEFSKHHSGSDVRQGITEYGSYGEDRKNIEIVPLCDADHARFMEQLIERLRVGKYKYKGSERTFSSKLTYHSLVNAAPANLEHEVRRLITQHPEWQGGLSRIFLVHCPESIASLDDETSAYYKVKRLLLEAGIPCQMVDSPTLQNPDWKDLNLALNIVAKCGQTPWVLPQSIPDCDFFIGLSYTQSARADGNRLMAFANVFNQYGRWEFYSGGSDIFPYEERAGRYEELVRKTLGKMQLSEEPTICFHYSARFSRDDRDAILRAARSVRPKGKYVFVWINKTHNVRLYDSRAETDGSMARGRYVIAGPRQIYLSTTGHNPYRRMLGTPTPLELNVWVESSKPTQVQPDLRILASQILSLTKLNWASTDSLCAEPITTKYAGDIAYLTAAFMRQGGAFNLHPTLERTPWFI
jgi:predicted HTH transcriptional regulator